MKALIQLVGALFKALLEVFSNKPIEEEGDVKDVGRKQPENPDDAFTNSDW